MCIKYCLCVLKLEAAAGTQCCVTQKQIAKDNRYSQLRHWY